MKRPPLQLALRDLRTEFSQPVVWVILCGVAVVLALAGAFGTGDVLGPVAIFAYWLGVTVATYVTGSAIHTGFGWLLFSAPPVLRHGASALAIGLGVLGLLTAINTAIFGTVWMEGGRYLRFAGSVIGVSVVVSLVVGAVVRSRSGQDAGPSGPALLARLPLDERGALVSLSAVDHYVEVVTDKGAELVLMRLSDAIAECAPVEGLHIHRSHWVALDQVAAVRPGSGKAAVTLSDGRDLPVSRANLPKLKEAGLLPR